MAQRLVLSAQGGVIPFNEIKNFALTAAKYGMTTESASYAVEDGELRISITLPKDVKVVGARVIKVKPKDKKGQAVDEQIEKHKKSKKENDDGEGYVPPVGRNKPAPVKKVKCPTCNVRKQLQNVGGVKIIKPHVVKGEACPGGGQQYVPPKKMK